MNKFENEFLTLRTDKPLVWLRHIDDVFFIWIHGEKELHKFREDLNNHRLKMKFTYILLVKIVSLLLIWTSNYQGMNLPQIYIKPSDRRQ